MIEDEKSELSSELIAILFCSKIEPSKFVRRRRHASNSHEIKRHFLNLDSLNPVCTKREWAKVHM